MLSEELSFNVVRTNLVFQKLNSGGAHNCKMVGGNQQILANSSPSLYGVNICLTTCSKFDGCLFYFMMVVPTIPITKPFLSPHKNFCPEPHLQGSCSHRRVYHIYRNMINLIALSLGSMSSWKCHSMVTRLDLMVLI